MASPLALLFRTCLDTIPPATQAIDKSTDHVKPQFDLFFSTISKSKKCFFSEHELKKALHSTE